MRFSASLLNPYVQLGVKILLNAAAHLLLKVGAAKGGGGAGAMTNAWTWVAITAYVVAFVNWLYVLRFLPVGPAFAVTNIVHVIVPLAAWGFLGESIPLTRWAGIAIVLAGVIMVAQSLGRAEEPL